MDFQEVMLIILTIILLLIAPILSLIPILLGIFLKKRVHLIIALFIAVISYNFIPNKDFDLSRHWSAYIFFKDKNIYEFISFLKIQKDYTVYIISYILSTNGLNPAFLNSITTFVVYYLYLKCFEDLNIRDRIKNKILYVIVIITYLLMLDLIFVISGIRTSLSTVIFIYGLYSYFENKKIKRFIICCTLSILTHIFMVNIVLIFLISLKIKNKKIIKIIFWSSLLFIVLPIKGEYVLKIVEIIPILKNYTNHISAYITGHESFISYSNLNWKGIIKYIIYYDLNYWLFLFSVLFIIHSSNNKNEKLNKFILMLYANINLLTSFSVIQERLIYVSTPLIYLYIIISEEKLNKIKRNWICLVFIFFILKNIFIFNQYKTQIIESYKDFYKYNLLKSNQIKDFNKYYDFYYIKYISERK